MRLLSFWNQSKKKFQLLFATSSRAPDYLFVRRRPTLKGLIANGCFFLALYSLNFSCVAAHGASSPSVRLSEWSSVEISDTRVAQNAAPVDQVDSKALPALGGVDQVGERDAPSSEGRDIGADDLSIGKFSALIRQISIPHRSPTLQGLLIDQFTGAHFRPGALSSDDLAVRLAVLYKAGQLEEIGGLMAAYGKESAPVVLQSFYALSLLGQGQLDQSCQLARSILQNLRSLQDQLIGQVQLQNAFCSALDERYADAHDAADLAKKRGVDVEIASAVVKALQAGNKVSEPPVKKLTLQNYVFLRLGEWDGFSPLIETAEPAALFAMTIDDGLSAETQLLAVEQAARRNVVGHDRLSAAYGRISFSADESRNALATAQRGAKRRALIYKALANERDPLKKLRLASAFLEAARADRLFMVAGRMAADQLDDVQPRLAYADYIETAIDAFGAAGDFEMMGRWAKIGGNRESTVLPSWTHWGALADLVHPRRNAPGGGGVDAVLREALRGRINATVLHRYVTVLDALGDEVPIPLWNEASKTAQPKTGYLPATGVLSQLQQAAKNAKQGRGRAELVLLVMVALGSEGAEGSHLISLADSIRALTQAGLDTEARQIGFEALFAIWPRQLGQ